MTALPTDVQHRVQADGQERRLPPPAPAAFGNLPLNIAGAVIKEERSSSLDCLFDLLSAFLSSRVDDWHKLSSDQHRLSSSPDRATVGALEEKCLLGCLVKEGLQPLEPQTGADDDNDYDPFFERSSPSPLVCIATQLQQLQPMGLVAPLERTVAALSEEPLGAGAASATSMRGYRRVEEGLQPLEPQTGADDDPSLVNEPRDATGVHALCARAPTCARSSCQR